MMNMGNNSISVGNNGVMGFAGKDNDIDFLDMDFSNNNVVGNGSSIGNSGNISSSNNTYNAYNNNSQVIHK